MLTAAFANQILSFMTGKISQISGGTISVGLSYTEPTLVLPSNTVAFEEPAAATGYERVMLGNYQSALTQVMGAPDGGTITNVKNVFFPKAITNYPFSVKYFLIFNGNTIIAYERLTEDMQPTINTVPIIEIGNLTISIT